MTDLEHEIEADVAQESAPELIATHYLTSIDDVVEHLRAASQLGLGVRVRSYLEEEDTDIFAERWELELLTSSPVQHDDPAQQEDTAQREDTAQHEDPAQHDRAQHQSQAA